MPSSARKGPLYQEGAVCALRRLGEIPRRSEKAPLFIEGGQIAKGNRGENIYKLPQTSLSLGQPPLRRGGLWADRVVRPYKGIEKSTHSRFSCALSANGAETGSLTTRRS